MLVIIAYLSLFSLGLVDNLRGPFFPDVMNDLQLNSTKGSLFFAITSLFAIVGSLSGPRILQRTSSLILLMIASGLMAFGFIVTSQAQDLYGLLVASAVFGMAFGALNLSQNTLVFEGSKPETRRRLMSGLHSMYGLAALSAPLVASGFRYFGFDWRTTFFAVGFVPLSISLLAFFAQPPREKQRHENSAVRMTKEQWKKCWVFALVTSGYLWGEISVSTRYVQWLRTEEGLDPYWANHYLTGFFVCLLCGRLFFSFVDLRRYNNETILLCSSLIGGLLMGAGLLFDPRLVILSGLAMAPFFPVSMDQLTRLFGSASHQALGFVIGFGSLSIVTMHVTLGFLSDTLGLRLALGFCAIILLSVSFAIYGLGRKASVVAAE